MRRKRSQSRNHRRRGQARLAEQRHRTGPRHVPARVAQERARPAAPVRADRAGEAPRRCPGRAAPPPPLAALRRREGRAPAAARGPPSNGSARPPAPAGRRGRARRAHRRQRLLVRLLDDLGEHEAIAVARDGADEGRLAGIVAQRAAQRAHGLAERAVRDDHVAPDRVQDLPAVHGLVPPLDQQHQEVEVARDQGHLAPAPQQQAAGGGEDEVGEDVARPWG